MPPKLKPLHWLGRSKSDLLNLPTPVIKVFGYALYLAQAGGKHEQARPLHGFGSADVLEITEDWRGNTYRAVYTVRFEEAIFVLHVFQKKSLHGRETPKPDMNVIKNRLKAAREAAKRLP